MTTSLEYDGVVRLFHAQVRSTQMWVNQYNKHMDVPGIRNVSLAIGKLMGLFNVLLTMNGGDANVDEEVIAIMTKYSTIWDELDITKDN